MQRVAAADAATQLHAVREAMVKAFHDGYFAAALFVVIALAASFLIHDQDAAASMVPVRKDGAPAAH
jgi:hypothetical protein